MATKGDVDVIDVEASSSKRARNAETPATVAARPIEGAMPKYKPKAKPVDAAKVPVEELVSATSSTSTTVWYPKHKAKPVDAAKIPTEELVAAAKNISKVPIQKQVDDTNSISSEGSYHDDLVDVPQEEDWDPYLEWDPYLASLARTP